MNVNAFVSSLRARGEPAKERQDWFKDPGCQLQFFLKLYANLAKTRHPSHIRLGRELPLKIMYVKFCREHE